MESKPLEAMLGRKHGGLIRFELLVMTLEAMPVTPDKRLSHAAWEAVGY